MQTTPIEDLLKLIWIRHLYTNPTLTTSNGGIVRVINPGSINPSAGVDILDARIEIDGKIHHGPIAVHQKASQWRSTPAPHRHRIRRLHFASRSSG